MKRFTAHLFCATIFTSLLGNSAYGYGLIPGGGNVTSNVPISYEASWYNTGWTGTFDFAGNTNVKVNIDLELYPIFVLASQYNASSKSRNLHTNSTYNAFPDIRDEIVYDEYFDVFGIPGLTTSKAGLAVITRFGSDFGPQYYKKFGPTVGFGTPLVDSGGLATFPPDVYQAGALWQLCSAGLAECRLGIVLQNETAGQLVFGKDDTTLHEGSLINTPALGYCCAELEGYWSVGANLITPNTNFKAITGSNSKATFKLSYREILGPVNLVRDVFVDQGVTINSTFTAVGTPDEYHLLHGHFPCDNPPKIGFQIGGAEFYLTGTAAIDKELGNNTCQSTLVGSGFTSGDDIFDFDIGTAFFEGHYVELNLQNQTIGIANTTTSGASALTGRGHNTLHRLCCIVVLNVLAIWWLC